MPYEPGKRDVRASDADREATVERLRVAGMEGRLDNDELEERIESAYAARWCGELEALTLDVTPPPARLHPMAPVFVRPARRLERPRDRCRSSSAFVDGWLGSVAAVIMGHIALRQIDRSGGTQIGRAAAVAGLADRLLRPPHDAARGDPLLRRLSFDTLARRAVTPSPPRSAPCPPPRLPGPPSVEFVSRGPTNSTLGPIGASRSSPRTPGASSRSMSCAPVG